MPGNAKTIVLMRFINRRLNNLTIALLCALIGMPATLPSISRADDVLSDEIIPVPNGYRFLQWYYEDNRYLGSIGVDFGYAAYDMHGFDIFFGSGFRAIERHEDHHRFGAWTALLGITVPGRIAPYAEVGFNAGEAVAELLIDYARGDDPDRAYVKTDTYIAAGVSIELDARWSLKSYYKAQSIDGKNYRLLNSGMVGFSLVRRFDFKLKHWWEVPPE